MLNLSLWPVRTVNWLIKRERRIVFGCVYQMVFLLLTDQRLIHNSQLHRVYANDLVLHRCSIRPVMFGQEDTQRSQI